MKWSNSIGFRNKGKTKCANGRRKAALCFVADKAFLPGLEVLIASIEKYNDLTDITKILITDDIEEFSAVDKIIKINPEKYTGLSGKASEDRFDKTYLAFEIFFLKGFDRVVFIDADILCLGDIKYLFSDKLASCDLAAAATFNAVQFGYLNSGVMVVNKNLLGGEFGCKLLKFAHSGASWQVGDQSALVGFTKVNPISFKYLPPEYNTVISTHRIKPKAWQKIKSKVRLLHYFGDRKPWQRNYSGTSNPLVKLWLKEASNLGFDQYNFGPLNLTVTDNPIFIMGGMRQGTTLLAYILDLLPELVYCPFELKEIFQAGGIEMAAGYAGKCPELFKDTKLDDARVAHMKLRLAEEHSLNLRGSDPSSRMVIKNPHLSNKTDLVDYLFPNAKHLWIYRDMRRTVASLKMLFKGMYERAGYIYVWPVTSEELHRCFIGITNNRIPDRYSRDQVFPNGNVLYLAEYWLETNEAVKEFLDKNPGKVFPIREEELIKNTFKVIQDCATWLGLKAKVPKNIGTDLGKTQFAECGKSIDPARNETWQANLTKDELQILDDFEVKNKERLTKLGV